MRKFVPSYANLQPSLLQPSKHQVMITITLITVIMVYSHHIRSVTVCLTSQTGSNAIQLKITLTGWALDANYRENNYQNKNNRPRVGLNHQPFG